MGVINPASGSGTDVLLADVVLAASAASIDVSSLPAYSLYRIEGLIRSTASESVWLRFNGDSTAGHYSHEQCLGSGASMTAAQDGSGIGVPLGTANTDAHGLLIHVLVHNAPTATGLDRAALVQSQRAGSLCWNNGARWDNTALITQMTIINPTHDLTAGSFIKIFGVK